MLKVRPGCRYLTTYLPLLVNVVKESSLLVYIIYEFQSKLLFDLLLTTNVVRGFGASSQQQSSAKAIHLKCYKHWPYTVAHTINCVCIKILNLGLNHGLFLSLFKLLPHTLNCICASLLFQFHI